MEVPSCGKNWRRNISAGGWDALFTLTLRGAEVYGLRNGAHALWVAGLDLEVVGGVQGQLLDLVSQSVSNHRLDHPVVDLGVHVRAVVDDVAWRWRPQRNISLADFFCVLTVAQRLAAVKATRQRVGSSETHRWSCRWPRREAASWRWWCEACSLCSPPSRLLGRSWELWEWSRSSTKAFG